MAIEAVLLYLAALALPVWLVVEQILSWWMFPEESKEPSESASARDSSTSSTAEEAAPAPRLPRQAA